MRFTTATFALAAFASSALAHMEMINPAPFRSKDNKFVDPANVDFDMTSPLTDDPKSNFPCKGYLSDLNTPAGTSTATWAAGSPQQITIDGGAPHNGGSCQLSMSYDEGKTFKVIKSIEGNCVNPAGGTQSFNFTVPADAKSGKTVFAWTWFNHTGNREMYMNCAAVTVTGSGTSTLADRPDILVAQINDCKIPEGTDVQFPNPGSDVDVLSKANLGPPTGNCGASSSAPPPSESVDPTDSTEPTYSVEPTGSAALPNPATPTGSTEPTGSIEPTDSTEPTAYPTDEPVPTGTSEAPTSTTTPGSGTGTTYTVVAGDICTNIAAKQNVSLSALFQLNPSVNKACTNLMPGQVLNLRRRSRIMRDLN